MSHRVQQDIDPDRIALYGKSEEEFGVVGLALVRVAEVGVVRRQHEDPAVRVGEGVSVNRFAVFPTLGSFAARSAVEADVRDLGNSFGLEERAENRMIDR